MENAKWCIKCNPEIYETLSEWFNEKIGRIPVDDSKNCYWHFPEQFKGSCTASNIFDNYEELSFEQFCELANLKQSNNTNDDLSYMIKFLKGIGIT